MGIGVDVALQAQTLKQPYEPIRVLGELEGWVLLLGVDHMVNTSIHYAERLAGRKQFVRWALTTHGIVECLRFPGCSDGFNKISPYLAHVTRHVQIGPAQVQAVPLVDLVSTARAILEADPLALLCDNSYCERCPAVRNQAKVAVSNFQ